MAMQINAGEVSRIDIFGIFPEHIIPGYNSRVDLQTEEEIAALAESILQEGQAQPALARRIDDNKVELIAGFGRLAAVKHINTVLRPGQPVPLQCKIIRCNAEEAFIKSITENLQRAATTPRDDAHAQRKLRESYGWSDTRIAEFYRKSVSYIRSLAKIPTLSTPIQAEMSAGNLSVNGALDVAELPEAEREPVVQAAKDPETGKVDSTVIAEKVRTRRQANGGSKARTLKEVKAFLEEQTGPAESGPVLDLVKAFLKFIGGSISEKKMSEVMEKCCGKQ